MLHGEYTRRQWFGFTRSRTKRFVTNLQCASAFIALLVLMSAMTVERIYADEQPPAESMTGNTLASEHEEETAAIGDAVSVAAEDAIDAPVEATSVDNLVLDGSSDAVAEVDVEALNEGSIEADKAVDATTAESELVPESEVGVDTAESNVVSDRSAAPDADILAVPAWRLLDPSYSSKTPLPASGKAMYYNPGVMERVLESRLKYDHIEPCDECIGRVAMLRFGDVNRKVWLQFYGSRIEGPFHVIDAAATQHVGMLIERGWILDVDYQTAQRWGMRMPYVTIWANPPLDILLANIAIPLHWSATMDPEESFLPSPLSTEWAMTGQPDGYVATKQSLKMQHRDVDSYVDLLSDVPAELYVK